MKINLTTKELQLIELINPSTTAEETVNKVLHDWLDSNANRMNDQTRTQTEKIDAVIAEHKK